MDEKLHTKSDNNKVWWWGWKWRDDVDDEDVSLVKVEWKSKEIAFFVCLCFKYNW